MTCAHSCDVISNTIVHDVFRRVRERERVEGVRGSSMIVSKPI